MECCKFHVKRTLPARAMVIQTYSYPIMPSSFRQLEPEQVAQVKRMANENCSQQSMANILQVSQATISRVLRRVPQARKGPTNERVFQKAIEDAYLLEMLDIMHFESNNFICNALGISKDDFKSSTSRAAVESMLPPPSH